MEDSHREYADTMWEWEPDRVEDKERVNSVILIWLWKSKCLDRSKMIEESKQPIRQSLMDCELSLELLIIENILLTLFSLSVTS
jgi:hypothetical protein